MPQVFNKYKIPQGETGVYIGRGSPWGNPFIIGKDGDRDDVCEKFDRYLDQNPELKERVKHELKGKNLICFCRPQRCHGDTLLRFVNEN